MADSTVVHTFPALARLGGGSPAWMARAACREENALLFFSFESETTKERKVRETHAKEICARCPVATQCLAYALKESETYGVWGGLGEAERKTLRRRRAN